MSDKKSDREFFVKCWNTNGKVYRMERKSIICPACGEIICNYNHEFALDFKYLGYNQRGGSQK